MSQENVETVRRIYGRWRNGDFLSLVEPFDMNLVYVVHPEFPDSGTYAGLDRVAAFLWSWLEPWSRVTMEAEEVMDAGDSVVVEVRGASVGRSSGVAGEFRMFHVWTFRAGKVIRLDAIGDRGAALKAAGLSE